MKILEFLKIVNGQLKITMHKKTLTKILSFLLFSGLISCCCYFSNTINPQVRADTLSDLPVTHRTDNAKATWQETLESHFDIVDTFDHYKNWAGSSNDGGCTNLIQCDLPVYEDESRGMWHMYDDYSATRGCTGPGPGDYWIAEHDEQWLGKSLRMSYSDSLIGPYKEYDVRLDFTEGGTYEPQIGDTIIGQTSGASSTITGIIRYPDSGSFSGGDELGEFYITNAGKTGTFQDNEYVNINGNDNTARLASSELTGFSECNDRLGPARMGMYFGDGTPESGYDEIYMFFMVKFEDGAFKYLSLVSRYGYVGTWKYFELEQGFVDVHNWEEGHDREITCDCDQDRHAYGDNFLITNIKGGGASYSNDAFRSTMFLTAGYDDGVDTSYSSFCGADNCWTYKRANYDTHDSAAFSSNSVMDQYEQGEWIGMELRWKIGTLGNNDAEYEEWLYNEAGTMVAHDVKTGLRAKRQFDNRVNKLVLGGNRFAQTYGLQEGDSPKSMFYIDDLIIDDQRIGPDYFTLYDNHISGRIRPNSPKNLRIR